MRMYGTRRWLRFGGLAAAFGVAALVIRLDARVRAYLAGPPLGGARIYAAPRTLRVGQPVPGGSLERILTRGVAPVRLQMDSQTLSS